MKNEALYLAAVSLQIPLLEVADKAQKVFRNGHGAHVRSRKPASFEAVVNQAVQNAQRVGVTHLEYMYARLLIESRIPIEEWNDERWK
jgi:hypothetical protein